MESIQKIIQQEGQILSPEKQHLLALEAEGRYVFHGTGTDTESLEPQQAVDATRGPDREPAVFASPAADFAIFHAIINASNFSQRGVFESGAIEHDDGSYELRFGLPEGALSQLADSATGWVYVFEKDTFTPIKGRSVEYESRTSVRPIQKIKVSKRDLPKGIEIIRPSNT